MVDPLVQRLLEQAVDSPVKLHLLLLFHENPRLEAAPRVIAERVCRDIWSVSQALQELAEDRVLLSIPIPGDQMYRYAPAEDLLEAIDRLLLGYDDPLERDKLQHCIRDLARYAPYRRATPWQTQVA
jgi:hypothetical protein